MRLLVNGSEIETEAWGLETALDFVRGELGLVGTKEGCREGDCGACAVLVGERLDASSEGGAVLVGERLDASFSYRAMPSCLLALGELEGRHLVTIEGLRASGAASGRAVPGLTPVMRALAEANGSQCGFCSPGFVVSLTAYLINGGPLSVEGASAALEGNLCRCTGYGSIKRAAARLVEEFASLPVEPLARLQALARLGRRARFPPRLRPRGTPAPARAGARRPRGRACPSPAVPTISCATPSPTRPRYRAIVLLDRESRLRRIERRGSVLELGAALNWREFFRDSRVRELVPGIERFERLLASPLVRERATLGGNIANASPVGDLTAMLIALGASVRLARLGPIEAEGSSRELRLERLFLGYKKLDLGPGEIIEAVLLPAERPFALFNFEKISKRETLDIAAVNSAASFELEDGPLPRIARARLSAGGVAPVPLFLERTSAFLDGRRPDAETALEAARMASAEISPIGDVRGSAEYRRRAPRAPRARPLRHALPGFACLRRRSHEAARSSPSSTYRERRAISTTCPTPSHRSPRGAGARSERPRPPALGRRLGRPGPRRFSPCHRRGRYPRREPDRRHYPGRDPPRRGRMVLQGGAPGPRPGRLGEPRAQGRRLRPLDVRGASPHHRRARGRGGRAAHPLARDHESGEYGRPHSRVARSWSRAASSRAARSTSTSRPRAP